MTVAVLSNALRVVIILLADAALSSAISAQLLGGLVRVLNSPTQTVVHPDSNATPAVATQPIQSTSVASAETTVPGSSAQTAAPTIPTQRAVRTIGLPDPRPRRITLAERGRMNERGASNNRVR
ncbi:hypothetical protein KCU65_g9960, partial [Aureobasidium melanogenum]